MKGKVLGFDAASGTGAINGENGQRYNFTAAEFKSPVPAKAGDNVDFEVEGANAKNIYATAAAIPNVDLAAMASNPTVAGILAKPTIIWAAVVILGSLIGGYVTAIQLIGGGPMGILGAAGFVLSLLFLIPVAAGVLIFFEFTNHALTPITRLATGALAAAGPIVLPTLAGMVLGVGGGFGGMGMGMGGLGLVGFHIDLGVIVTVAGGVLILLTHFGIIKKLG